MVAESPSLPERIDLVQADDAPLRQARDGAVDDVARVVGMHQVDPFR